MRFGFVLGLILRLGLPRSLILLFFQLFLFVLVSFQFLTCMFKVFLVHFDFFLQIGLLSFVKTVDSWTILSASSSDLGTMILDVGVFGGGACAAFGCASWLAGAPTVDRVPFALESVSACEGSEAKSSFVHTLCGFGVGF